MEFGFRKLMIWKLAHELTLEVYKVTAGFPNTEMFGLTSQIRRSASSVAANIVEGYSRGTTKQYVNFLMIANGSLEETKYFLLLAKDLNYLEENVYNNLDGKCNETGRLLGTTIKKLGKGSRGNDQG